MLESIEKLREYAKLDNVLYQDVLDYADEIEREISERYMLLPVDADGVLWRHDDCSFIGEDGLTYVLMAMKVDCSGEWMFRSVLGWHRASKCRHVKQDSLEALLDDVSMGICLYPRERVTRYLENNHSIGEAVMLDVRDRLRDLLGGDAE